MLTYAARSIKFGGARTYLDIIYIIAEPQGEYLHKSVVVLKKYEAVAKVGCWANILRCTLYFVVHLLMCECTQIADRFVLKTLGQHSKEVFFGRSFD